MDKLIGACLVAQSGGPTAVINASAYGVIRTALDSDSITHVYGAAHGIKGVLDDILYDLDQEDEHELRLLLNTPSASLGSCRYKLNDYTEDDTDFRRIMEVFKKLTAKASDYYCRGDALESTRGKHGVKGCSLEMEIPFQDF